LREPVIGPDGTAECARCGLPLFPLALVDDSVALECANRHHVHAPLPTDRVAAEAVRAWIARRGAQLHEQHERWGTDDERPRDREEEI
jgi:hypothetical protein